MLYELLYIIPAKLTEEEAASVETKVASLLVKYGGTTESTKRLGKFRLAYPIDKEHFGYYVLVHFSAEPMAIAKIEEAFRITSEIMRHLILRADEAGADQKFDLVQFTEVNVETKEDRRRRERRDASKSKEATPAPSSTTVITTEELEQKIETALSADTENV